jgi:hypothetical protein
MRRRKSVGTVRKAGGVRCLFDGRPLGLSASGLLVVGAVFGDRLTKQTVTGCGALGCKRDMVVKAAGCQPARVEHRDKAPTPSASTKRSCNGAALGI